MKLFVALGATLFILGYLFIQWANKPENVAALKQQRLDDAAKKKQEQAKQAEIAKIIVAKKATMKLVIDEDFAKNEFKSFTLLPFNEGFMTVKEGSAVYRTLVTKGQNARDYFLFAPENVGDFMAEVNMGVWGYGARCGLVWDAQLNEKNYPTNYQAAYSSPDQLYVKADDDRDSFGLGGIIVSENKQVLRVERIGTHLLVSVNGKVLFNQAVESNKKGKIGLYVAHGGGGEYPQSVSEEINSVKIWQ